MPAIMIAGHMLAYTMAGPSGAPVLFLAHGFMSHRGVWRQTLKALKDRYRCVAVDLLGFGESEKPEEGDYRIETQGRRILQLADALGCERFTLIGHSMGGQIALCIASLLAPERIVRLLIVSGVVTGRLTPLVEYAVYPQIALGAIFPSLYAQWRSLAHYPWYAYFIFRPWFYRMDGVPFESWEIDRAMALQPGMHLSTYRTGQAIRNFDLTAHLGKVAAPTLAIYGRQDGVVPIADGFLLKRQVPRSQLVLIDQCGHYPMYEQPQAYLHAVRGFLINSADIKV